MKLTLIILMISMLTACSTRQEGKQFSGSTEQRLVSYSIDKMMENLPASDFDNLRNKKLFLNTHFVVKNNVVTYATERLKLELMSKYNIVLTGEDTADFKLDMFFTSLGTDRDSTGISLPIVNLSDPEQSTVVNVLAVDMYHGVSEGFYYVTDLSTGISVRKGKASSRIRTDNFTTPFFSFPISQIDD